MGNFRATGEISIDYTPAVNPPTDPESFHKETRHYFSGLRFRYHFAVEGAYTDKLEVTFKSGPDFIVEVRDAEFEPIAIPAETRDNMGWLNYRFDFADRAYVFELPEALRDRVMGKAIIEQLTERVKTLYSPSDLD